MKGVEKIVSGELVEFDYKGLKVDKDTWESAPIPICCDNISDEDMECIVVTLYDTLVQEYGEDKISLYIGKDNDLYDEGEWDNIDDFRWREEEELFIEWGGVYYEDME